MLLAIFLSQHERNSRNYCLWPICTEIKQMKSSFDRISYRASGILRSTTEDLTVSAHLVEIYIPYPFIPLSVDSRCEHTELAKGDSMMNAVALKVFTHRPTVSSFLLPKNYFWTSFLAEQEGCGNYSGQSFLFLCCFLGTPLQTALLAKQCVWVLEMREKASSCFSLLENSDSWCNFDEPKCNNETYKMCEKHGGA